MMRALRHRYGRALHVGLNDEYTTAYGTVADGNVIYSETRKVLGRFRDMHDAARAWSILAAYEGQWGDSADTFDAEEWRFVRGAWRKAGLIT